MLAKQLSSTIHFYWSWLFLIQSYSNWVGYLVELSEREQFIIAVTVINSSERAQGIPPKMLGHALNELRKVHTPNIPINEMQNYVDAVRSERQLIMADLAKGLFNVQKELKK